MVSGQGEALIDARILSVGVGDTIFVPMQAVHRLSNVGTTPLVIIETQLGVCVEEDIIRLADDFDRVSD